MAESFTTGPGFPRPEPSGEQPGFRTGPGFFAETSKTENTPESDNRFKEAFLAKNGRDIARKAVVSETATTDMVEVFGGDCGARMTGSLPGEGVVGFINNYEGIKGQDALAINRSERRFAV